MSFIDDFSPLIVGSDRIEISLDPLTLNPTAGQAVIFRVDYSGAKADGGVVLPFVFTVQAPTIAGYYRKIFRRSAPSELIYFPISSGPHLVRLAEIGHNKFFGALPFQVAGDPIIAIRIGGRQVSV